MPDEKLQSLCQRLRLPQRTPPPGELAQALPEFIEWLRHAPPLTGAQQTGEAIRTRIEGCNRHDLPPRSRLALLEASFPYARRTAAILRQQRTGAPSMTHPRYRSALQLEMALLACFGLGYMILIEDALCRGPAGDHRPFTGPALVRASLCVGTRIVTSHSAYEPAPTGCWRKLHTLRALAGTLDCASTPFVERRLDDETRPITYDTVDNIYKALILIAAADPYRLVEGELDTVYRRLVGWADQCRLLPLADLDGGRDLQIVDPGSDHGPRFHPREAAELPADSLIVESRGVAHVVAERMRDLIRQRAQGGDRRHLGFQERNERSLLRRLHHAWSKRPERQSARTGAHGEVDLAAGFNTAHHHLSDGRPFEPELAEFGIYRIAATPRRPSDDWNLVPVDHRPWRADAGENRAEEHMAQRRKTAFASSDDRLDAWSRVYAAPLHAEPMETFHPLESWTIENRSPGGLALRYEGKDDPGARVGGIVLLPGQRRDPGSSWYLGTVRWMRRNGAERIGVHLLTRNTVPIGVRAVSGTGGGSEYQRAFAVDSDPGRDGPLRIVVPAALYDIDTVLAVNDGEALTYAVVTRIAEGTRRYTLAECKQIDTPLSEQNKLAQLRGQIRAP